MFHEVRVLDSKNKLKKIISGQQLSRKYWKDFETSFNASSPNKKGKKKSPIVKSYTDSCTDTSIEFTVKLHMGVLPNLVSKKADKNISKLEKVFGLTTTKSTSNMYLFDQLKLISQHFHKFPKTLIEQFLVKACELFQDL